MSFWNESQLDMAIAGVVRLNILGKLVDRGEYIDDSAPVIMLLNQEATHLLKEDRRHHFDDKHTKRLLDFLNAALYEHHAHAQPNSQQSYIIAQSKLIYQLRVQNELLKQELNQKLNVKNNPLNLKANHH